MAEIQIAGLSKTYPGGKSPATDDVHLSVADGEFVVLLGPSGCGKTTLLRMLAGLEVPDAGVVHIGGRDVTYLPPRKRDLAMVFQSYAVFPHKSVFDNIGFGLAMRKLGREQIRRKVEWAAGLLHLEPYLGRQPAQLSGGQRQRVAVARAIVMEPQVLLMDEPLSNLDALLRLNFRAELKRLVKELGTTCVYVTHDQTEALSLGDRVAVMRDGCIVQYDDALEVYDQPADTFVGGFIGSPPMAFLRARLVAQEGRLRAQVGEQWVDAPLGLPAGDVLLGLRAENLRPQLSRVDGALRCVVQVTEPLGSHVLFTVGVDGQEFKAYGDQVLAPGTPVWVQVDPQRARWFDAETGLNLATSTALPR